MKVPMQPNQPTAFKLLERARNALKSGDKSAARQFATQAARLAPELEDAWLLMAALAGPQARVEYLRRALQINPHSERAKKGLAWTKEQGSEPIPAEKTQPIPVPEPRPQSARKRKNLVYAALLGLVLLCLVGGVIFASAATPVSALFSLVWAPVPAPIAAPSALPTKIRVPSPAPTATFPPTQTFTASPSLTATTVFSATPDPSPSPSPAPSETATEAASPTPLATDTPEPTLAPSATLAAAQAPAAGSASTGGSGGAHWIDVDLTHQMVYAYEGDTLVNSFLVSTGAAPYRTVTGSYAVYERHIKGNMWGPGYFLPDVPYIMYFHKGYALHGAYWHTNFGTPMSHGCVNLSIPDAEWLYYWSSMGTRVKVHY